jgi:hypothetical protein
LQSQQQTATAQKSECKQTLQPLKKIAFMKMEILILVFKVLTGVRRVLNSMKYGRDAALRPQADKLSCFETGFSRKPRHTF